MTAGGSMSESIPRGYTHPAGAPGSRFPLSVTPVAVTLDVEELYMLPAGRDVLDFVEHFHPFTKDHWGHFGSKNRGGRRVKSYADNTGLVVGTNAGRPDRTRGTRRIDQVVKLTQKGEAVVTEAPKTEAPNDGSNLFFKHTS